MNVEQTSQAAVAFANVGRLVSPLLIIGFVKMRYEKSMKLRNNVAQALVEISESVTDTIANYRCARIPDAFGLSGSRCHAEELVADSECRVLVVSVSLVPQCFFVKCWPRSVLALG